MAYLQAYGIILLKFYYVKICKIESHSGFNLRFSDYMIEYHIISSLTMYMTSSVFSRVFFVFILILGNFSVSC